MSCALLLFGVTTVTLVLTHWVTPFPVARRCSALLLLFGCVANLACQLSVSHFGVGWLIEVQTPSQLLRCCLSGSACCSL